MFEMGRGILVAGKSAAYGGLCKEVPMRGRKVVQECGSNGFTLVEVLVSMVLVSMITLIMAFAFRMSLQLWERGENEGEKLQIEIALPYFLERQLRSVVEKSNITYKGASKEQKLDFYKKDNLFSFYTTYSPLGTPAQGLIRVAYLYEENEKQIKVYEKVIGSQEDINESSALFSKPDDDFHPVATITDVELFSLTFSPEQKRSRAPVNPLDIKLDISDFQETWDNAEKPLPTFVHLRLSQAGWRSGRESGWLLKVGGSIY